MVEVYVIKVKQTKSAVRIIELNKNNNIFLVIITYLK